MKTRRILTGYTVQLSDAPLITCTEGREDDRDWFARHHGRNYRIRKPRGGEIDLFKEIPRGCRALVVVRQFEPGARMRCSVCWRGSLPLDAEHVAKRLFAEAASHNPAWIAAAERAVKDGLL
jgi:hypothetical protein